jgi:teichoic acid transport system ATP-binding protein
MICDRVAWMHFGELREIGPTDEVINHYRKFSSDFKKKTAKERKKYQQDKKKEQIEFNIDEYRQTLIDDEIQKGVDKKQAEKSVQERMYNQITPDKMSLTTRIVTGIAILGFAFFALVNISGHSITSSLEHPTTLIHPVHHKVR